MEIINVDMLPEEDMTIMGGPGSCPQWGPHCGCVTGGCGIVSIPCPEDRFFQKAL